MRKRSGECGYDTKRPDVIVVVVCGFEEQEAYKGLMKMD